MSRDDFSATTIRTLAAQAGYCCSHPDCGRVTIGPSAVSPDGINSTGVAAHITAAAEGGPRYDATLTAEERSSIDNGIWLCALHARWIDGDEVTFSVEILRRWKANRKRLTHLEQGGLPAARPFCSKVSVANHGRITTPVSIDLGKITFITGSNGTGKTQLCEGIAALATPRYLERWRDNAGRGHSWFELEFFVGSEPHRYRVVIEDGQLRYFLDEQRCPPLSAVCKVLYVREHIESLHNGSTLWTPFAHSVGLSRDTLHTILTSIGDRGPSFVSAIRVDEDDLLVKVSPQAPFLSYQGLSGGEQMRVVLDMTLHLARFHSKLQPTILIIELDALSGLGEKFVSRLMASTRDEPFQSIFVHWTHEGVELPAETVVWQLVYANDSISALRR